MKINILKAQKNSKAEEYITGRTALAELLEGCTRPIDINDVIIMGDGTVEVFAGGNFCKENEDVQFCHSETRFEDLKAFSQKGKFYQENHENFEKIRQIVLNMETKHEEVSAETLFGLNNFLDMFTYKGDAYVIVRNQDDIPAESRAMLENCGDLKIDSGEIRSTASQKTFL